MASTATKTVEGHQGATRPNCTPAPGVSRVLAGAALAAGFAAADATVLECEYFLAANYWVVNPGAVAAEAGLPCPVPVPCRHQVGNAMHVANIGCVVALALGTCTPCEEGE